MNRVVVVLGLVVLLFGLYSTGLVIMDVVNVITEDAEANVLQPTIRAFIALLVGVVVLLLGTGLEFTWDDEAGY